MKQIIFSTLAMVGMFCFISCDRHSWEGKDGEKGTKLLFPKKHSHDEHEHDDHGDQAGHGHPKEDKGHDHSGHDNCNHDHGNHDGRGH